MVDKVKVYISELDGVDLVYKREYLLKAENVPYEDSPSSDTVKEKLDAISSEFDDVWDLIYSQPYRILAGTEIPVPSNQQLINIDGFIIEGQLTLSGSLVI